DYYCQVWGSAGAHWLF
nr:immunoglobulin light chain junction region [Macaca mulatta]MOW36128.1 immunoglobulin light chain junction region [Macaca mulatta]MOW36199.1 immunoglobulin light chain junction region [Macaca mulatta]MOW36290.1 immunoglobulin light chain junction region [Macaca mulatta]MOW36295.1 immunoglobulin light chain junction region [Macaca mulatta]